MLRPSVRASCAVLAAVAALMCGAGTERSRAQAPQLQVDIEIAVDTTGSMTDTLATARRETERIVGGVRDLASTIRFAVVSFRDPGNPGGEYGVLQDFTSDAAALEEAFDRLKPVRNPGPNNLAAESYNLVFHRSHGDRALSWRPAARKIVLVIGDAEPYGAGAAGVRGCRDDHPDPHGLNTANELAAMRKATRTLIMVRVVNSASTSLECYDSLSALAFDGGAARNTRSSDLARPVADVVGAAMAPISITLASPTIPPGGKASLSVSVANLNDRPLHVSDLALKLASGLMPAAGQADTADTVRWQVDRILAPGARLGFRIRATAAPHAQWAAAFASGHFDVDGGASFSSFAHARIPVTRRILIRTNATAGRRSIAGLARFELVRGAEASGHALPLPGRNTFTVRLPGGGWVQFRPLKARLSLVLGRARATIVARVTARHRVPACGAGSEESIVVTDHGFGAASGATRIHLEDGSGCRLQAAWWLGEPGGISPAL